MAFIVLPSLYKTKGLLIRLLIFIATVQTTTSTLPTIYESDCGNHTCDSSITEADFHYKKHGCFCDTLCEYYNDCCWDYKGKNLSRIETPTTECRSPTKSNNPIMMIVSCPAGFNGNQSLVDNCKNDLSGLKSKIPVSGRHKQLVYRNFYCALCNGETNYTFWNQKLSCPHIKKIKNLTIDNVNFTKCFQSFQNPYPNTSHHCSEYLIKSCKNSTENNCKKRQNGVVFSNMGNFYKNIYCFQCNRIQDEELMCGYLPNEKTVTTPYSFSSSYFILIDFNRRDVRLNGRTTLHTCPHGHWFDYAKRKCRQVMDLGKSLPNTKVLNCSLEKLQKNDYVLLPNQTIYRNSTKTFYDADSYMIKNTSDVFICHLHVPNSSLLETYLTFVGMGISLSALSFLILFYMLMPAIWNLTGLIYLSFSVSLFLAQVLFLVSRNTTSQSACTSVATSMHYAFLVSFFWLNVVTVNIWLTVCRNPCEMMSRKGWKRFLSYSLYAWLAPLIIIIIALMLDKYRPDSKYAPRYGDNGICWLNNNVGVLLFFAIPLAIIILLNFAAYIHTAVTIYKMRKFSVQNSGKGNIKVIIINAKLCLLTGITWIFGYVAAVFNSKELRIVFVVLNATYGLWLAICFLTSENVFSQLKQKFRNVTQSTSTKTIT